MIMFVTYWPDMEEAKKFDLLHDETIDFLSEVGAKPTHIDASFAGFTCHSISEQLDKWLKKFAVVHMMCFFVNIQREIFDT